MREPSDTDRIFISKLTEIIHANLENDNFGVKELALRAGLTQKVLNRKLKKISGKSVSQYIRETRLNKALELLREEIYTVSEVGYKVGFNSPVYFTRCFHEFFGYPPGKVKKGELSDPGFRKLTGDNGEKRSAGKSRNRLIHSSSGIVLFIIVLSIGAYLLYSNFHHPEWTDDLVSSDGSIAIAVMPFQNFTKDTTWNIWQDGLQGRFISTLANNPSLKVKPQNIINKLLQVNGQSNLTMISPSVMRNISRKFDAILYVSGSIREANSVTSIDAQLISTRTNEVIKSFKLEGYLREKDAFHLADTLSQRVMNFLMISRLAKDYPLIHSRSIDAGSLFQRSAEEYRYCYYGDRALKKGENELAISWYKKALAIDSTDFGPMIGLSSAYGDSGQLEEALKWVLKYYKMKDKWPLDRQLYASWAYAYSFEPPEEGIKYLRQLQDLSGTHIMGYLLGYCYCKIKQYYKAIPEYESYLKMSRKFGREFLENNWVFPHLAEAYNKTGQFRKERKLIREWEKYNPGDPGILHQRASLALSEKDVVKAGKYIERYSSACKKEFSASEAEIQERVGRIYYDTGIMDTAEEYYRKAVLSDPDNPARLFRFAGFLTETGRSPGEVPGMMDKAMQFARNNVDYYNYLDEKGWGLYKQGRVGEAMAIIEKAWNEAPFKLYALRSHLEEVKKAAAIHK
jgi:AraC-like DNA-binding protein/tetratricopeptide (TPR) repeat protein